MKIDYAAYTHEGEREYNEDSIKVVLNTALLTYGFLLADGLGGHGRGADASGAVVRYIEEAVMKAESTQGLFMDQCFYESQEYLLEEQRRMGCPGAMCTTLTFLMSDGRTASWGHIGDSRIYFFRENQLLERTKDHSYVQMLVDGKKIKEKDMRKHPDKSRLTKAMGVEWDDPEYEIDRKKVKLHPGDSFLLCSDGFWEWIEEKTMARALKKAETAQDALNHMIDYVYKKGRGKNMDNCSAILVRMK